MAGGNDDLHGSVPDDHTVALLLVDVINPCEFPEADAFLSQALLAVEHMRALKRRANAVRVPLIYTMTISDEGPRRPR